MNNEETYSGEKLLSCLDVLRESLVVADLTLMQLSIVENRLVLAGQNDDVKVNLDTLRYALKDAVVISIARLFDKKDKGGKSPISLRNLQYLSGVEISEKITHRISALGNEKTTKKIMEARNKFVAHSDFDRNDVNLTSREIQDLIDKCYDLISYIIESCFSDKKCEKNDIGRFRDAWDKMLRYPE